jgi:hypothetical protein
LKPKHIGGYSGQHVRYCEQSVFLAGGLVPRYLFPDRSHAGTTDVDLVVSLDLLAETEAYRMLDEVLAVLAKDFASDALTEGYRKNGPVSYARFLTDPGAPDRNVRHPRDASSVVEAFLEAVRRAST